MNNSTNDMEKLDLRGRTILVVISGLFVMCAGMLGVSSLWDRVFPPLPPTTYLSYDENAIRTQVIMDLTQTAILDHNDPSEIIPTLTFTLPNPSSVTPNSRPSSDRRWVTEIGQIPDSGTEIIWELEVGQVMILTGGQFQIADTFCGGDPQQICVLIIEATVSQIVTIYSVIPKQNFIGITEILSPMEILNLKDELFWIPPNCINGCQRATVLFVLDGKLIDLMYLSVPLAP